MVFNYTRSINSREHKSSACANFKLKNPQADVAQSLLMLLNLSYFPATVKAAGEAAGVSEGGGEFFKADYISDLEEDNNVSDEEVVSDQLSQQEEEEEKDD